MLADMKKQNHPNGGFSIQQFANADTNDRISYISQYSSNLNLPEEVVILNKIMDKENKIKPAKINLNNFNYNDFVIIDDKKHEVIKANEFMNTGTVIGVWIVLGLILSGIAILAYSKRDFK